MGSSEQVGGENIIHGQKMEGGSNRRKSGQQELKEEEKYKN